MIIGYRADHLVNILFLQYIFYRNISISSNINKDFLVKCLQMINKQCFLQKKFPKILIKYCSLLNKFRYKVMKITILKLVVLIDNWIANVFFLKFFNVNNFPKRK